MASELWRAARLRQRAVFVSGAPGNTGGATVEQLLTPLPPLAEDVAGDARVSETPLVDKGFASVRKIGNGLYATISDLSKGNTTLCNE